MLTLLRASVLTAGIIFLTCQTKADEYGPADTASFLPSCTDHFEACRTSVIAENNLNKLSMMSGKHGCEFPRTPGQSYHDDTITVTKAILVWLNAHQASLMPKTSDAINQAKKALWPGQCH